MEKTSLTTLRRKLSKLGPLRLRNLKSGMGTFLFLNFVKSDQGDLESIWLDCCSWRFLYAGKVIHSSFCSNKSPKLIFKKNGLEIPTEVIEIGINNKMDLTVLFGDNLLLECFSMSPTVYQHWHLFFRDYTISGGPSNQLSIEPRMPFSPK